MRWKKGNRIKLVSEADAPIRTRAIFDEVCQALGIPSVPLLYQAYATLPAFLELHWLNFKPILQSRQFFQMGARLAAESYTRAHNYFDVHGLRFSVETPATGLSLAQVLDYYQYLDPLLLLVAVAQTQAFEGPVGNEQRAPEAAVHPHFPYAPTLVSEKQGDSGTQQIWVERRRLLDVAFVSEEHRAMAVWPEYYRNYWAGLKTLVNSPLYADCQYRIGESAWGMVRDIPGVIETSLPQLLDAGLSDNQVASIFRINESLIGALTGVLLDVTFARIGCEAGARDSTGPQTPSPPVEVSRSGSPTRAA